MNDFLYVSGDGELGSFHTIEGEGPSMGKPTLFLRLAMCNLTCQAFPCDTIEMWKIKKKVTFEELSEDWKQKGYIEKLLRGDLLTLSILGTEPVYARTPYKRGYFPIETLWDSSLDVVEVLPGVFEQTPKELSTLTYEDGQVQESQVSKIYRHLSSTGIKIETNFGATLQITESHSVFILGEDGTPKPVLGKDLRLGDFVLTPDIIPSSSDEVSTLDLLPIFEELGFNPKVTDTKILGIYRAAGWEINRYLPITPELGELCGYYCAEGSSGPAQTQGTLALGGHELYLALRIKYLIDFVFGCDCVTYEEVPLAKAKLRNPRAKSPVITVRVNSGLITKILNYFCSRHAKNIKVPDFVFSSSKKVKSYFIGALLEGDGHGRDSKTQRLTELSISTISSRLQAGVGFLALELGICHVMDDEPCYHIDTHLRSESIKYKILFSNLGSVATLKSLLHENPCFTKVRKVVTYSKRTNEESYFRGVPRKVLHRVISKSVGKKLSWSKFTRILQGLKNPGEHPKLKAANTRWGYLTKDGTLTEKGLLLFRLEKTLRQWNLLEIKKLEIMTYSEPRMFYDLEVAGSHNFVAGNGRILAHNSGGEPLLQERSVFEFVQFLGVHYVKIFPNIKFETNATITPKSPWDDGYFVEWCCSPKLSNNGDQENKRYKPNTLAWHAGNPGSYFKFVVKDESDIDEIREKYQNEFFIPGNRIWLMPMASNRDQLIERSAKISELCKENGYNFSSRLHLVAWNQATGV